MEKNRVTTKSLSFFTIQVLLLSALYFVSGLASFSLAVSDAVVTLVVFAAEGFALAAVILWGKKLWPGVFLGQLLLALYNGLSWYTALGLSTTNSLEAVIGAILFHRLALQYEFTRMRDVSGLLLLIFFVLQPFSATLGVLLLWQSDAVPSGHLWLSWFSWWFGNALGQAIITPLVLSFFGDKKSIVRKLRSAAWLILLAIPIGIISLFPASGSYITIAFTIAIPLLILIAAKGGMALVTLATVILTVTTLFFTRLQITESLVLGNLTLLLNLNAHLLAIVLTGQFVAALLNEFKQVQLAQREVSDHLQKIADNFPGVIYQYRLHPDGSSCFPYASVGMQNIYQIRPEEVKEDAAKVFSVWHPEDYDQIVKSINISAKNLTPWQCDYRVRYEGGEVRWLSGHSVPQREENGAVLWHGFIEDVTDVKQKEIEYQTVLEASFSGFFCADLFGNFLDANSAICRMLGYTRQELLKMNVATVEVTETADEMAIHIQAIVQAGHDNFETRYLCKDGSVIDIEINVLYSEALGRRFFVFASDISARKRMEEQLRESEYKFRQFIEKAPIPIAFINENGELEYVNERFERQCGYSIQDVPTLENWWSLAYPDENYRSWVQSVWGGAIASSIVEETDIEPMEYNVTCKDGTVRVMIISGIIFSEGLLATLIDVTERKQMELELRKNHDELLRYFEQPFIGMLTASHNKQTLHVNQRFCDMVGYSKEELQIINWGEITHPDDIAVNQVYLEQAIRGEIDSYQMEKRYIHKDGHLVYVDLAVQCVRKADGQPDYFIGMMLDITRRKQVEHYLQKNQVLLQTAQRAAKLGHYVLDLRTLIWTNDMLFNEIIGIGGNFKRNLTNWQQLIFSEDRQQFIDYFAQTLRDHEISPSIEYRIVRPSDGVVRWIADWGHNFYDDNNNPVQQVGMIQDITERKYADQQLQESEERLNLSQEYGGIGSWEADLITNKQIWSRTVYTLLKFPALFNPTWDDFLSIIHAEDRQNVIDATEAHFKQGKKYDVEYRVILTDGQIHWMRSAGQAQFSSDGTPLKFIGIVQDITERKQAETELRVAATVFEAQEGMLITDADCRILKINHAFTDITGYSAEEAIGQTPHFLQSEKHDRVFYDALWQSINETGAWQGEIWDRRKDGQIYPQWLTITAVKNNNDNTVSHYVATQTDITERKATEEHIHRLAFYDPLTQLPNRRLLKERLKHGIEMSRDRKSVV